MTGRTCIYRTRRRAAWWGDGTADQIRYFHHRKYAESYIDRWTAKGYTVSLDVAERTNWEEISR